MFHVHLGLKDLQAVESGTKQLRTHFELCETKRDSNRARCFYQFLPRLESMSRDLKWTEEPDLYREGKGKFGTMFLSFVAMSTHIVIAALDNVKLYKDQLKEDKATEELHAFLRKCHDHFFIYEKDIMQWRLDQITAVELCEVTLHLWKEFEQSCESRWRRSIDDEENEEENVLVDSGDDDSSADDDFDDILFSKADGIGGLGDPRNKRYRARVFDDVTKTVIFEKEADVIGSERSILLQKLWEEAVVARGKVENKVRAQLNKFNNETVGTVRNILTTLLRAQ